MVYCLNNNSAEYNRPQHESLGSKPHKLYFPKHGTYVHFRVYFNISKLVYCPQVKARFPALQRSPVQLPASHTGMGFLRTRARITLLSSLLRLVTRSCPFQRVTSLRTSAWEDSYFLIHEEMIDKPGVWVGSQRKRGFDGKVLPSFSASFRFFFAFRNLCGLSLQFKLNLGLQQYQSETEKVKWVWVIWAQSTRNWYLD